MTDAGARGADWRAEPKVELHLHLEGATPPALARAWGAPDDLFDGAGYAWGDFTGFLGAYDRVAALFARPEGSRALAEAVLRECAANGVIYAEVILSPDHVGGDAGSWAEHLAAVTEGAEAAEAATGVTARFIAVGVRQLGPERVEAAARLAAQTAGRGQPRLVGFNMAGDERVGRPADYARAFAVAREAGLGLTAHAGEFGGPDSVAGALDDLGVDRVSHGVRAVEDPALVARLAERRVHLEICPGSNVALGVYPDWAAHPLPALRAAGCSVGISTDDPPFFRTTMTREYEMAAKVWGFGAGDLRAIARDSIEAAFCDEDTKARLRARLTQA
ncbi:MAG: adenosine deaminase [Rubrimonas sp.]